MYTVSQKQPIINVDLAQITEKENYLIERLNKMMSVLKSFVFLLIYLINVKRQFQETRFLILRQRFRVTSIK